MYIFFNLAPPIICGENTGYHMYIPGKFIEKKNKIWREREGIDFGRSLKGLTLNLVATFPPLSAG